MFPTKRLTRKGAAITVVALAAATLAGLQANPSGAQAPPPAAAAQAGPDQVSSASDAARAKLHPRLRDRLEAGENGLIRVYATVGADPSEAAGYLQGARVADGGSAAMVFGRIRVQELAKLAGAKDVVAVGPIDLRRTGRPLGDPDPEVAKRPTAAQQQKALAKLADKDVPYSKAPPPAGSNFEALKDLALLDAKTHAFADAWEAGFTGTGTTVGVLDGGTDFGHPDLLGTWQTWSGQTGSRAGWNGWPKAFDPYGVLQWLAAPSQIGQGLSWYVETVARTCPDWASKKAGAACPVMFSTRTGPSRNFSLGSGTRSHLYQFAAGVTKSGNVRLGSHPDDHLLALYGERPAFLVTDSTTAGVYDTVYVDLDNDYKFDDEKPATKASPASYRDMNGDSYTDLSGGLLYYISDGATAIPGGLDAFGVLDTSYGPGELLAWSGDYDPAIGGHGTLTASNIVGQGVINGRAPTFSDLPGGKYPGAVIGGSPHAKLAPYGDIYFSFEFSTQLGYFLATRRGVDVTSNSYGSSDVDNDGWDAASQEADVIHANRTSTAISSTGNGAPGFGTVTPPSPTAFVSVGASTQFGGTGWDSIDRTSQIVDGDVIEWSNRGFGANGTTGVDVVADGAYSAGDITLNAILNGRNAWETWGGTSRSTPVAAAATALVYQAWRATNGPVPAGFFGTVKDVLKSSADDLGYDSLIQGSGSVNAARAVAIAQGSQARVSPNEWRVGDYRGTEYPVFTHLIAPGGSDAQSFTIEGPGTWQVSDRQLLRTDSETFSMSSKNIAAESPYNFNAPDYLVNLTSSVNAHPDADLMVVRVNYPYAQFDGDGDYQSNQAWRTLAYNWTDLNDDGNLWTDTSGDGVVDHANLATSSNPDGNLDLDFTRSEMDKGEYVRFMYHRPDSNASMVFVRDPADRMTDGLFLGLQHQRRNGAIPVTDFDVQVDYYENSDWSWVTTPASATGSFQASVTVPEGTPYGMYSGAVVLTNGDDSIVVPVAIAVAATVTQAADGALTGSIRLGGPEVAQAQSNLLYNNGSVFGATDWSWRAESGDWRFFYLDVPAEPAPGSLFLTRTTWDGTAPYTDLDTLTFGPTENHFQVLGDAVFGAPYVIGPVGGSPNTNTGAGVWQFNTATGDAEDLTVAPVQEGLHAIALHQVGWQADQFHTPFTAVVGSASVAPTSVEVATATDSGSFDVTFTSGLDLDGLTAEAFGLSQPSVTTENAAQDNPADPSSASVKRNLTLNHASRLTVSTALGTDDLDLFLVRDENNDGLFTNSEIVAASATGTSNEFVELVAPADGNYQVWVQGFAVAGTPSFELAINAIQGNDLTVTGLPAGPVAAGDPVTLHVEFTKPMTVGEDYFGELLLGPPSAPAAIAVPIQVSRE
jgi:hypothetical protein